MNPLSLLAWLGAAAWIVLGTLWILAVCRAAIRKNQPERRDEPSLTPKRGGSECRPVAQFSLRRAVRFNPTLLAVGLVVLCGCETPRDNILVSYVKDGSPTSFGHVTMSARRPINTDSIRQIIMGSETNAVVILSISKLD